MDNYYLGLSFKEIEKLESLDETTQKLISESLLFALKLSIDFVNKCESPIEKILAATMYQAFLVLRGPDSILKYIMNIYPQKEIVCGENTYRVDFCIEYILPKVFKLVVECDGHEYHEKTKEQAAKDKKRDRQLIKEGYHVIHFTGSEIYKDPYSCMKYVLDLLIEQKKIQGLE